LLFGLAARALDKPVARQFVYAPIAPEPQR
jgi:hypothetical protein